MSAVIPSASPDRATCTLKFEVYCRQLCKVSKPNLCFTEKHLALLLVLCWGSGRKVRDGRRGLHCEKAIHNKHLITWFSGQYGETLHLCAAFSLAYGLEKYLYTLVQYLAILPTKPDIFMPYSQENNDRLLIAHFCSTDYMG